MMLGLEQYNNLLTEQITNTNASLLLYGLNGIGKFNFVYDLLFQIVSNHENIKVIDLLDNKKEISIEQVRELFETINIKPFGDDKYFIIINNADKMNSISFNHLLKRLEEPKQSEQFILITDDLNNISDTIKSRCIAINLQIDFNIVNQKLNEVENPIIRNTLSAMGFSTLTKYLENDTTKVQFQDCYNLLTDIKTNGKLTHLSEYAKRFKKFLYINQIMMLYVFENDSYVVNTYEQLSDGYVSKDVLIELLIYHIISNKQVV